MQQIRPDGRQCRRMLPDAGFVIADPHHLRCTVRGIGHQTRPLGEQILADRGDQTIALLGGPFVQPDDRRAQWLTVGVAHDDAVDLTAQAHRHDPCRFDACGRRADGVAQCGAIGVRILFRPAVVLVRHAQGGRTGGHHVATLVDDDDLDALRADVDSQDQRHVFPQITVSESACRRSRSRSRTSRRSPPVPGSLRTAPAKARTPLPATAPACAVPRPRSTPLRSGSR